MKKAVLIGAGGVGTITAMAVEASKQVELTLVVRSLYDQVKEKGYNIDSISYGQIENWKPSHVAKTVEDAAKNGPYDYIIVSTKFIPEIQKTEDLIRPLVTPGCTIVLIQNGIGNEPPVMEAFPNAYVLGGVSIICSINYAGKIQHTGFDELFVGTLDKRPEATEKAKEFAQIYGAGGKSRGNYEDDLMYRRWCKLVYNATINPTAALTQSDVGRLYFAGDGDTVIYPAMAELRKIAEASLGKKLPEGIEQKMWNSDDGSYFKPSMLVDEEHERPMELEAILGNPLRYGAQLNVETPILRLLYSLLRARQFTIFEKMGLVTLPKVPYKRQDIPPIWSKNPWDL